MRLRIPTNLDGATSAFMRDLFKELDGLFAARTPDTQTIDAIYLTAPDKSVWKVSIGDTGTLATTKIRAAP